MVYLFLQKSQMGKNFKKITLLRPPPSKEEGEEEGTTDQYLIGRVQGNV